MTIVSICFIYFIELINQNFIDQKFEIFLGIFIISWIGQFIGHKIEGKKPAFVKDLQFLLIDHYGFYHIFMKNLILNFKTPI